MKSLINPLLTMEETEGGEGEPREGYSLIVKVEDAEKGFSSMQPAMIALPSVCHGTWVKLFIRSTSIY